MTLTPYKIQPTYITLCVSTSIIGLALFAGIAAACGGFPGGGGCEKAPTVTTEAATSVTSNSAYLNGSVNEHGCAGTTYFFEYKESTSKTWKKGNTYFLFGEAVSEWQPFLSPETTYHFRLKASNAGGSGQGSILEFTTLEKPGGGEAPSVTTEAATGIMSNGATLNGSVNPNGSSTTYKFEYGTTKEELNKSTTPVDIGAGETSQEVEREVGLDPGTLYYFRIVASNTVGTTPGSELSFTTSTSPWEIQETPNPEGASDSNLFDVSCEPSTEACTAVGRSTVSGVHVPIAQRWNGSSWSEQAPAKKAGSKHNRLIGIDCPSEARCIAVGNYQNAESGPATFAQLWNEGEWSNQTTPVPEEASSSEYVAVGCNSTANCTAVGSAVIGGVKTAIAARWNSPTWTASAIPIPEGATSSQLDGVDCNWSNFCMAVGRYTDSEGGPKSLLAFWNGTEWELETLTDPEQATQSTLLDVSCTQSPNRCTAVGGWKNSKLNQFTLAYRFNGSIWSLQSTPNPPGSIASVFQEVSCPSESSCTAAGSWVSGGGGSNRTLAEKWEEGSWSIQGTPNPVGAVFSAFFGASCQESSCLGVGWSTDSSGVDTTLGEFRE